MGRLEENPPAGFTSSASASLFADPVVVTALVLAVLPGLVALLWQRFNLCRRLDPYCSGAILANDEGVPCTTGIGGICSHPVMGWMP